MNNPGASSSVTHVRSGLMKALINHSSAIEKLCAQKTAQPIDPKDMPMIPCASCPLLLCLYLYLTIE